MFCLMGLVASLLVDLIRDLQVQLPLPDDECPSVVANRFEKLHRDIQHLPNKFLEFFSEIQQQVMEITVCEHS